ncbi:MAG: DUF2288 domain-containing protein [Methylococcales bacterium]
MPSSDTDLAKEKVHLETASIAWKELQRFFAGGTAVFVGADLDLVDVAHQFALDNKTQVEQWLQKNQVSLVSDQQALQWIETDAIVWAVVVKPWVLVQP